MIQTRILITLLVLALGYRTAAHGDDAPKPEAPPDPCVTELTLEKLDNPPERKTKFERVDKPVEIRLNDVKLVDNKYAAFIEIKVPMNQRDPFGPSLTILRETKDYKEVNALQIISGSPLLAPTIRSRGEESTREGVSQFLERLFAQIPAERLPANDALALFESPEVDRLLTTTTRSSPRPFTGRSIVISTRSFVIYATTPELAEERASALLTILDHGYSRPIQLRLFKFRQEQCQLLAEHEEKHGAADQQLQAIDDELKKYADFTDDTLPGVRVQQFQADAELAGLRAKVQALDKLLAKADQGTPRFQQLDAAKVAAEVELVGCAARRATIGEIIGKIKLRNELTEQRSAAGKERAESVAYRSQLKQRIARIDEEITAFGPVRLVDDRVVIQALEWIRDPSRP